MGSNTLGMTGNVGPVCCYDGVPAPRTVEQELQNLYTAVSQQRELINIVLGSVFYQPPEQPVCAKEGKQLTLVDKLYLVREVIEADNVKLNGLYDLLSQQLGCERLS